MLPWPKEQCQAGIDALQKDFDHLEVQHYYSHFENGKITVDDIPRDLPAKASYIATLFWLPKDADEIPKTKLIQFFSAGTNHVAKHPIYTDSKIPLCSANGVHGPQIAEWVVMMDLVHSHNYTKLYDLQKERTWNQRAGMNVSDRVGKRVGILGYGSIGRQGMYKRAIQLRLTDIKQSLESPKLWVRTSLRTQQAHARPQRARRTTATSFLIPVIPTAAFQAHGTAEPPRKTYTIS